MSKWSHASLFLRDYKVVVADTPERLSEVYKIRHQVYCEELKFEPICHQSLLEYDEFDSKAIHCLVMDRMSQEYIGCVRVVHSEHSLQQVYKLPFQELFGQNQASCQLMQPTLSDQPKLEISRLAIKPSYRRSLGGAQTNSNIVDFPGKQKLGVDQQQVRLVSLSLYCACALIIGDFLNGAHCYAMMEKRLVRHLRHCGIYGVEQVSPYIEHNGRRALFCFRRESTLENIPLEGQSFLDHLRQELTSSFANRLTHLALHYPYLGIFAAAYSRDMALSA